ncbi:AMP-binding protein [Rhodococcus opacus]|uniref:AMP-binding protein n=1 Tax=Rhodococcus opacus TaxID=37919 RepID=UPI002235C654|nr:AMP-binding protein [Rhodococcus opacus]UZG59919.1 AMP-binding protein [Rhodococcus opacus]
MLEQNVALNIENIGQDYAYERGPDQPAPEDLTVGEVLRRSAASAPERLAIVEGIAHPDRRRWTYTELLEQAEACARALLRRYSPGDHIAIWAPNIPEYTIFQCGAALAGMVMVTVNPTFREAELEFCLRQSRAVACFVHPEFRGSPMLEIAGQAVGKLDRPVEITSFGEWNTFLASGDRSTELPEVDPVSPAQIQYTSGTTGRPKGAMLTHRGVVNDGYQAALRAGGQPGAVWLAVLPMFHVGGCVYAGMGTLGLAGTLVPLINFEAGAALRLIEEERVTIMNPVPTMILALMRDSAFETADLSSLKSISSGGAPVPAEMVRQIESKLGVDFTIVFGQTEASGVITMTTTDDSAEDKAQSCGRPLPGIEIKIVDPVDGSICRRGAVGELLTRGYHTMVGYYDNPEGTAAAFSEGGWMNTQDLCSMDERGYIRVEGRAKDMIIRGGENIFPREIEDELFKHDAVADVAVVGVPDEYYGEVAAAFVKLAPGANTSADELDTFLRPRLTGYKIPAKWYLAPEFPQTLSGKIQKFAIRDAWSAGQYQELD